MLQIGKVKQLGHRVLSYMCWCGGEQLSLMLRTPDEGRPGQGPCLSYPRVGGHFIVGFGWPHRGGGIPLKEQENLAAKKQPAVENVLQCCNK